jgi:hypothetical protein
MSINITTIAEESVVVSNTPLRLGGASSWTGADANNGFDRIVEVTNNGTAEPLLLRCITAAASLPNLATMQSDYVKRIDPGKTVELFVRTGQDVCIVRNAAAATKATLRVHIL